MENDDGSVPYEILEKTLNGGDYVFIQVDEKIVQMPESVKSDTVIHFKDCCTQHKVSGAVILFWYAGKDGINYYPQKFLDAGDFLRRYSYQDFKKLFHRRISCPL